MSGHAASDARGIAIGGYDAVAYHEQADARRGDPSNAVEHAGRSWHFASAANAEAFRADPERYAPAYGGRCAFGTSLGKVADGDPKRWQIQGGRLFLNSNAIVHVLWKLLPGRVQAADRHWGQEVGAAG